LKTKCIESNQKLTHYLFGQKSIIYFSKYLHLLLVLTSFNELPFIFKDQIVNYIFKKH